MRLTHSLSAACTAWGAASWGCGGGLWSGHARLYGGRGEVEACPVGGLNLPVEAGALALGVALFVGLAEGVRLGIGLRLGGAAWGVARGKVTDAAVDERPARQARPRLWRSRWGRQPRPRRS